jgi:hypothetical protein
MGLASLPPELHTLKIIIVFFSFLLSQSFQREAFLLSYGTGENNDAKEFFFCYLFDAVNAHFILRLFLILGQSGRKR